MHAKYLFPLMMLAALPGAHAEVLDCQINGVAVNPFNQQTLAGKSGNMICKDASGDVREKKEIRNGKEVGNVYRKRPNGSIESYTVDDGGKLHGMFREYHPNGQLAKEARYDHGKQAGLLVRYYPSGTVEGRAFYENESAPAVSITYTPSGKLASLQCAERSVIAEDRPLCGFEGKPSRVTLYSKRDRPESEMVFDNGVMMSQVTFDADGRIRSEAMRNGDKRTVREFFTVSGSAQQPATGSPGNLARESIWEGKLLRSRTTWYMNGRVKEKLVQEPGTVAESRIESYRQDGTLERRETFAEGRLAGMQQYFDKDGRLAEESLYEKGRRVRVKKYSPDGQLISDNKVFPDGSLGGAP